MQVEPPPFLVACSEEEQILTRSEIWRLEKYLRNLFRLDTITIVERPKQADSVEVQVAGEFIGVIFKDEEDGIAYVGREAEYQRYQNLCIQQRIAQDYYMAASMNSYYARGWYGAWGPRGMYW